MDELLTDTIQASVISHVNSNQNNIESSVEECTTLEMDHICRGCLNVTEVCHMRETFIDGVTSLVVYEDISQIKDVSGNVPQVLCTNCFYELAAVNKFMKMLQHSYTVLDKAAHEIKQLQDLVLDLNQYNSLKQSILKNVISRKVTDSKEEDIKQINVEYRKVNSDPNFSTQYDVESSDDDVPLSERFELNLEKISQKNVENKNKTASVKTIPSSKRSRQLKENVENVSKNRMDTEFQDTASIPNSCPLCSKNIRYFTKHLQSSHNLDWNDSRCLRCSYQNATDKVKLLEHSKECTKIVLKVENQICAESDGLKTECTREMEDSNFENDHDMDLDLDLPDRIDPDDFYEDEDVLVNDQYKKRGRSKKYTCNKCRNISFAKYDDVEKHLKDVHSEECKCILCEHEFTNSFTLLYHMMVKHGKLKCCRLCLVSFKNAEELNAHYKSEEHNTKCTVCGEQLKNRKALYEHRRKKHLNPQLENQKFKCPECPKEFANQNNIRRHILVAHNDLRFLCDTCGQSYTTKRNLQLHIQKFHEGIEVHNKPMKKNFFCEACGRELKIFHKFAIAMHRAKHIGHNFVCKKCYDSFPTEDNFKKHVEELGHHLFECDKCQAQFVREENFKLHLKNHDAPGWNKNMFATWGKSAKLRNEKGEFVCSYCPKVFKDKQRLDNHVRVHTNERPYKCHICSKGFKTWIHRKTHLNIHLGIKKWVCKFCAKAFTNSCTLKGHEMIHTGERPHRCPECKKGFITLSAMKKHRMVHFRQGGTYYVEKEIEKDDSKDQIEKSEGEQEENVEYLYKYGQIFTGSDVSYEEFPEATNKEASTISLVSIEKELSC